MFRLTLNNFKFSQESSGDSFQSDLTNRGGTSSSPARGRGRGGGFDRSGSNMGPEHFRGIQDSSNRGTESFGGTHLSQEQSVGCGFRDQKSGLSAAGDFGGYGMSQQDHGTKAGGPEPTGNFGEHGAGQRSVMAGPNSAGHDSYVAQHAASQHGFVSSCGPIQDSKSGSGFGGPTPSKQEPKVLHCGPNRGPSNSGGSTSQHDCSVLGGNFTVPPPSLAQQDTKGMPQVSNQGSGDFGGTPLLQKPLNMLSPTHTQQFPSASKSAGEEKKDIAEGETLSDGKDEKHNAVKLDFIKNTADGIPGLDLLAEQDKQKNDAKASAEERELSLGHDIDERSLDKSVNPNNLIGPVPAPTSTEQANDQGFGTGRPPSKLPFQQSGVQDFGPDSKFPLNNQGFRPGSQNSPNVQGFGLSPKGPFHQGPSNQNVGPGGSKVIGNNENQPNVQNFGPGAQGLNQSHGIGNQGSNQPFGPGNQGSNQYMGPGNQDAMNPQGFGSQSSIVSRGLGPDGSQGFGSSNQAFGPGSHCPSHSFGPGNRGYGSINQGSPGVGFQGNNQAFGSSNIGPQNNQSFGPGQFGGASGSRLWSDGGDGSNRGGWNQASSWFDGPRKDNVQSMKDNFQGTRDSFQGMRDNFQGQKDNFQGPVDRSQGPRDNFQGPRDNFFGPRDSFHGLRDNFQGPRDGYQGPRDNFQGLRDGGFQGPRDNFQPPREGYQGPRDNFSGPGDRFLGPRDNFGGPREAFQGPRDNFQGPKDRFSGPPFGDFGYPGESEFGRGGPHDFPPPRDFQPEGCRGGPQDFGSEYGRGRGGRGRARGRGGFGPVSSERSPGDELSWQRGCGRGVSRFGPGTDDQRVQQPDLGPSAQVRFSFLSLFNPNFL